jgi:hypothetical protein
MNFFCFVTSDGWIAGDDKLFMITILFFFVLLLPLVLLILFLIAGCLAKKDGKYQQFFSHAKGVLEKSFFLSVLIFVFVSVVSLSIFAYFINSMNEKERIDGFSDYLIRQLNTEYDLDIPDSAQFIEGSHQHSFRDPTITLTFSVSKEDFYGMFVDNWREEGSPGQYALVTPPEDYKSNSCSKGSFGYTKKEFVRFTYQETEPGLIVCELDGPDISSELFVSDRQGG